MSLYPSSTSLTTNFDITNDHSVSLLNLDEEDSELVPEEYRPHELDDHHLQSNFPSPSYNRSSTTDFEDLGINVEQPLFWPFENKFAWNPKEANNWCSFVVSPRNDIMAFQSSCDTFDRSINKREKPRLVSGPIKASKILERRERKKNRSTPSRLRRASASGVEMLALETKNDLVECSRPRGDIVLVDKSSILDSVYLMEGELSIELLGLGEFDGHEGLGPEFNQDDFSLQDSLS